MARVAQIDGDFHVNGSLSARDITYPDGSIANADIEAAAGLDATKLNHQNPFNYMQTTTTGVLAATAFLHTFRSAATILAIDVTPITAPTTGDLKYSVDLQKGNAGSAFASVLSAVVTITQTDIDRTPHAGSISTSTAIDGDLLKLVVTTTGSTGAQGLGVLVTVWTREAP